MTIRVFWHEVKEYSPLMKSLVLSSGELNYICLAKKAALRLSNNK